MIFNVIEVIPENEVSVSIEAVTQFKVTFQAGLITPFSFPKSVTTTPGNRTVNAQSFNVILDVGSTGVNVVNSYVKNVSNVQLSMEGTDSSMTGVGFIRSMGNLQIIPNIPPSDGQISIDCLIIN